MIPFNLPHNPKPSAPAIRKPNLLRASGPYYHICYVRCAISNLRPPNCFYNTSPVHPRFLFSCDARAASLFFYFSPPLSTSLKRSFDKLTDPFLFRFFSRYLRNSPRLASSRLALPFLALHLPRTINFIQLIARLFRNTASHPKGE